MKRDMELVRKILLAVEANPQPDNPMQELHVDGFSDLLVHHHVELLYNAGLLSALERKAIGLYEWYPICLTWSGHEFLDTIRDPETWAKTKIGADAVKSWSVETIKDIAKGLVKKQIEEWTGVKVS